MQISVINEYNQFDRSSVTKIFNVGNLVGAYFWSREERKEIVSVELNQRGEFVISFISKHENAFP